MILQTAYTKIFNSPIQRSTDKDDFDIPLEFRMTREEMEDDLMSEYSMTDMTWDELLEQMDMIEAMFDGKEEAN